MSTILPYLSWCGLQKFLHTRWCPCSLRLLHLSQNTEYLQTKTSKFYDKISMKPIILIYSYGSISLLQLEILSLRFVMQKSLNSGAKIEPKHLRYVLLPPSLVSLESFWLKSLFYTSPPLAKEKNYHHFLFIESARFVTQTFGLFSFSLFDQKGTGWN